MKSLLRRAAVALAALPLLGLAVPATPAHAEAALAPTIAKTYFTVVNEDWGWCLDTDGTRAYTNQCTARNPYQVWHAIYLKTGMMLKNDYTGKCLKTYATWSNAAMGACDGTTQVQWRELWDDGYSFNLMSNTNGRCFYTYPSGRTLPAGLLHVTTCNAASASQRWAAK